MPGDGAMAPNGVPVERSEGGWSSWSMSEHHPTIGDILGIYWGICWGIYWGYIGGYVGGYVGGYIGDILGDMLVDILGIYWGIYWGYIGDIITKKYVFKCETSPQNRTFIKPDET